MAPANQRHDQNLTKFLGSPFCCSFLCRSLKKGAWVGGEPIRTQYFRASVFLLVKKMICKKLKTNLRGFHRHFDATRNSRGFWTNSKEGECDVTTNQLRQPQNFDQWEQSGGKKNTLPLRQWSGWNSKAKHRKIETYRLYDPPFALEFQPDLKKKGRG